MPYVLIRPFVWIAVAGFLVGFSGFLLWRAVPAFEGEAAAPALATASGPVADDWNRPKPI
jgi:hypothetical protein